MRASISVARVVAAALAFVVTDCGSRNARPLSPSQVQEAFSAEHIRLVVTRDYSQRRSENDVRPVVWYTAVSGAYDVLIYDSVQDARAAAGSGGTIRRRNVVVSSPDVPGPGFPTTRLYGSGAYITTGARGPGSGASERAVFRALGKSEASRLRAVLARLSG
jgi:hypothetical protein